MVLVAAIGLGGRWEVGFVGLLICPTGGVDALACAGVCADAGDVLLGPAPGVDVFPAPGVELPATAIGLTGRAGLA